MLAATRLRLTTMAAAALAIAPGARPQSAPRAPGAPPQELGGPVENLDTAETFATLQAAIDDADTLSGHTLSVAPGTYAENVWLDKSLTLLGAQAGVAAPGRVVGAPDPLLESVLAPASGDALALVTGSAASVIDGFAFVAGDVALHALSGPVDQLEVVNNHFQGQLAAAVSFLVGGTDVTLSSNAFHAAPGAASSVDMGPHDFDGLHLVGNHLLRVGAPAGAGLAVDGFNNVGPSVARTPLIAQNRASGHAVGMDLGSRSFTGGSLLQNEFVQNGTGLGFGIQNSTISGNLFAGNERGLWLSSLGDSDPTRGAFGNTVSGNQFLVSAISGVELDAAQAPGSIGTNVFDVNCFEGNGLAVDYLGSELIAMEDNWWGDASGPQDPTGTNPASPGPCPPVPLINAGGLGDPVTGENLDYCPWIETPVCQSMAILADDCQDDAFPGEAGQQVVFELWMTDLGSLASGFQAFLEYGLAELAYRGDLSSYSVSPFSLHVQDLATAEVAPGQLRLDGSASFGGSATQSDSLLATLVFDVVLECASGSVAFDLAQPFDSAVSFAGVELPTMLANSPAITLDDSAPVFDPYADITVAADAGSCAGALVDYPAPTAVDACTGPAIVSCSPVSGSFFSVGTTAVLCTAVDPCGNEETLSFDVTVTPTNLVDVQVELLGVSGPVTRCIRVVMDDCVTGVEIDLLFTGALPASVTTTVEVPCGAYSEVFMKDRQHSLWAGAPLVASFDGKRYEALTPLLLRGGDTDDDGDVDINDVTWFMGQFGTLAASGGCPWDGTTRDADFSVNGAVGSEDYVFLTAHWLLSTTCGVPLPAGAGSSGSRTTIEALDATTRHADLNRDGRVDHDDVALFEERHSLPRDLSRALRAASAR